MQVVFWVYEKNKWRNYLQFPTCFRGLVDRRVGCKAKGPRFKTYLGSIKKLNFYRNFTFFSTFLQNENSPYKTASPQTNFGLYNIGSEMPTFRARAIYFWQLSIESPCTRKNCNRNAEVDNTGNFIFSNIGKRISNIIPPNTIILSLLNIYHIHTVDMSNAVVKFSKRLFFKEENTSLLIFRFCAKNPRAVLSTSAFLLQFFLAKKSDNAIFWLFHTLRQHQNIYYLPYY